MPALLGVGPGYLSVRHGWTNGDAKSPAWSLGLNVPTFPHFVTVLFSQIDLYRQFGKERAEGLDRGLGTLISVPAVVPYLQLGRIESNGRGWYTTQALSLPNPLRPDDELFGGADEVTWLPSINLQRPLRWRDEKASVLVTLHVVGSLGVTWYSEGAVPMTGLTAAVSLEFR